MATILIAGESGSGKTSSICPLPSLGIEGLNPSETFYLTFSDKSMPFRGHTEYYEEGKNWKNLTKSEDLPIWISNINKNEKIKNFIIDDATFSITHEEVSKLNEKGFEKYIKIASNFYNWIKYIKHSRKDLNTIVIWHTYFDKEEGVKLKTSGKLIAEKVNIIEIFETICHAKVDINTEERYFLIRDALGKSGLGMFPFKRIPNDLGYVIRCINAFNKGEDVPIHKNQISLKETIDKRLCPYPVKEYIPNDFTSINTKKSKIEVKSASKDENYYLMIFRDKIKELNDSDNLNKNSLQEVAIDILETIDNDDLRLSTKNIITEEAKKQLNK